MGSLLNAGQIFTIKTSQVTNCKMHAVTVTTYNQAGSLNHKIDKKYAGITEMANSR